MPNPFHVIDFAYNHVPKHTHFRELMAALAHMARGHKSSDRMPTTDQLEGPSRFAAEPGVLCKGLEVAEILCLTTRLRITKKQYDWVSSNATKFSGSANLLS